MMNEEKPLTLRGVISSKELLKKKFEVFDMGKYSGTFGAVTLPFTAMISGLPGSGKTTFFMEIGAFFSKKNKKVLFVSNEEGVGATLQNKLQRMNHNQKNLDIAYEIPEQWHNYDVIILDSVNSLRLPSTYFDDIKKVAKNKNVTLLGIFKATKEGIYKGESDYEHDVDISLSAENGTVSVRKNRFGGIAEYGVFS